MSAIIKDVLEYTIDKYIRPNKFTIPALKDFHGHLVGLLVVDKDFKEKVENVVKKKFFILKQMNEIIYKYLKLYSFYDQSTKISPPYLITALSGASFSEKDIKDIVSLMPESLDCDLGSLWHRENVSPLVVACFNDNIPLRIIEFLLQNGANPNFIYKFEGSNTTFLEEVARWDLIGRPERIMAIKNLFEAYAKINIKG